MRVTVRKRDRPIPWEVRWREHGKRYSRSFSLKTDADRFAGAQERRLQLGVDYDAGSETLAQFLEEYWRSYAIPNLAPRTRTIYKQTWARHLLPRLGHLELREITPAVVEDFRAQLEHANVGAPTVIKALALLQGILGRAVVRGRISANPVREVKKPRQRQTREPAPLAPATVEAIRAQLTQRDATLVSLLAYQGLRPDETVRLHVEHLRPSIYTEDRKRHKPRRVKWLAPAKADVMGWLMARHAPATGLVFPARNGGEWDDQEWRYWRRHIYVPAAKAAGVTGDLRPYRLRGSFVSLLLWEGRDIAYVAKQAGHSVATLSVHYAGVLEELVDAERVPAEQAILSARQTTERRAM